MPTRMDAHLPIAHGAAGATIAAPAMIPATLMLAKARACAQRRAFRKVTRLRAHMFGFAPIAATSGRLPGCRL